MSHLETTHINLEENSTLKHSEECRQSQAGRYNFILIKLSQIHLFFLLIFKTRVWCGSIIDVGRIPLWTLDSDATLFCASAVRRRGGGAKLKQIAGAKRTQLRQERPLWVRRQNGTATRTECAAVISWH